MEGLEEGMKRRSRRRKDEDDNEHEDDESHKPILTHPGLSSSIEVTRWSVRSKISGDSSRFESSRVADDDDVQIPSHA